MRNFILPALLIVVAVSACKEPFRKGSNGIEYKIISSGKGEHLKQNDFMQIHVTQLYQTGRRDSVLSESRTGRGPMIEMVDSFSTPPQYFGILTQLRKGDSLVMRSLTDSVYAKADFMPAFFKKGHYLVTTVKVLNIFKTRAQADSAQQAETAVYRKQDSLKKVAQIRIDDQKLKEYFSKNKIDVSKLIKAPKGTYVEIIQPGTGPLIDTSMIVKTNYTGRKLDGTVFDSNVDSTFNHKEPFNVNLTSDYSLGYGVIGGWVEGLQQLNKGAKAKFYVPSPLAYGENDPRLGQNAILIFDIEVLDILNKEQAAAELKAITARNEARQKRYLDSLKKLRMDSVARVKAKPVTKDPAK